MPATLLVGAGGQQGRRRVVDRHEGQHQAGRVGGGELLVEHDLLGGRHAAAPLGGPVRDGVAGAAELGEPGLLEAHELLVPDAGLGGPPALGHVFAAPVAHRGPELSQIGRRCHGRRARSRRAWRRWRWSSLCIDANSATKPAGTAPLRAWARCMFSTRFVPCTRRLGLAGDAPGHPAGLVHQLVGGDDPGGQAQLDGDLRCDPIPGVEVLPQSEARSQQRPEGGAAVPGDQPHRDVGVGQVRVVGDEDDVAEDGDAEGQPDGGPVDGGRRSGAGTGAARR